MEFMNFRKLQQEVLLVKKKNVELIEKTNIIKPQIVMCVCVYRWSSAPQSQSSRCGSELGRWTASREEERSVWLL